MTRQCAVIDAGQWTYTEGLQLQVWAWEKVASGEWDGILILQQHFPVITLGRKYNAEDLLWSSDQYISQGVDLVHSNRGGKATCHNLGQLVGYPVLNLSYWKQDSHWYLRLIEQIIINTIDYFGIQAKRKPGYTGVWVKDRKIAAIGVAIRRWITSHGFALNVENNLSLFETIVPCGIHEFGVTNLLNEGITRIAMQEVREVIISQFEQALQCSFKVLARFDNEVRGGSDAQTKTGVAPMVKTTGDSRRINSCKLIDA